MSRLDKALAELAAEKPEETKPTEPKPEETQVEQPSETPEEKPEEKPEEPEQPAEPTEGKPEDKAEPDPKPKKEIPDDPMKRAEYSFRRQLDKNNKKHADELAARDKEIAELKARFAEIEKKTDPNNAPKTRKDFENDDDYIDYLTQRRVDKILAERDAEEKEADDEAFAQQRVWMENVHAAFNDEKREQEFYAKVQYCSQRGLGQILDECPAAADFLMNHPHGPRVMEKVLNDQQTFRDVFGDGSRRVSQLDVYYALRRVDERMDDAPAAPATPAAPAKPTMPHLGKPGKQAGAGVKPDIYSDPDEMLAFVRRFK